VITVKGVYVTTGPNTAFDDPTPIGLIKASGMVGLLEVFSYLAEESNVSVSEPMRAGVFACASGQVDPELSAMADAAKGDADSAGAAIDDAMASIAASTKRIADMELAAVKSSVLAAVRKRVFLSF
jgi:hypothetical protein